MKQDQQPEPWLRGTLNEVPAVQRAVLHALELAKEDLHRWCFDLTDAELNAHPADLPSLAFQLRHIARSLDRLLTYAEGKALNDAQLRALKTEADPNASHNELFAELDGFLEAAAVRVRAFVSADLEQPRSIGKKQLPTTLGGLLVHIAEHTQRHTGQAINTAKIVRAQGI